MSQTYAEGFIEGVAQGRAEARAEVERLRVLLQEVLDDEPMYKIDRITAEKIRAALGK